MKNGVVKKTVVKVVKEAPKIKAKKAVKKEVVKSETKNKKASSKLSAVIRHQEKDLRHLRVEKIKNAIVKNKDIFIVYNFFDQTFLICKKISLEIKKINEKSVFQPREYTEKKNYCVLAVFETENSYYNEYREYFEIFLRHGCPVYKINRIEDIELSLKEMG